MDMSNPIDFLKAMEAKLAINNKSAEKLTYEQVCMSLRSYCGWNPKTRSNIESKISTGLPDLTNVSVRVEGERKVTIKFCMPNGDRMKYNYP